MIGGAVKKLIIGVASVALAVGIFTSIGSLTVTAQPTPTPTSTATVTPTPTQTVQVWLESPAKADRCSSFSATVNTSQVENFDSASYDVSYDPEMFDVTAVHNGSIGATAVPVSDWGFIPDGIQGVVRIINNVGGVSGVTGDGTLAVIDFDVDCNNCGNFSIDFTGEHVAYDRESREINTTWTGNWTNVSCPL